MTSTLIKKILVSAELASSEMGVFFQELGFELHQKYVEGCEYLFIVDSACPELPTYPRLQISDSLNPKFAPYVRARISKEMFESVQGKKLLTSYFHDALEFDLVDRYSKDFKDIYTVKIHDYLNLGFFVDTIIVEAYKAQFDIEALRSYLNTALNFAFKKVEMSKEAMPIDVSYSHNGEAFTVQISLYTDKFKGKSEFGDNFSELTADTNYFDSTYFHKKKKLTLSSLFYKNTDLNKAKSYFFTEVASRSAEIEEPEADLHSGLVLKDKVNYETAPVAEMDPEKRFSLARKFALFIRNYRKNEESPIPISKLEVNDVINYLGYYPRQEALQDVDEEIKNFIFKLLKDDNLFNGIDETVQRIANTNLDSQMSEIQKVLGEKSLSDIEDIMLIKGGESEQSTSSLIKGWAESSSDFQRISGQESGMSDNDRWEVRKLQLNVKIQDEVTRVNAEGRNIVQDDIVRVMAKELDAKEQDVKNVVGGIVEEVVSTEVLNTSRLEEEFAKKILNTQSNADLVKEKLESQISRMKKIMDQLKREIIKLQAENTSRGGEGNPSLDTQNIEAAKLKMALGRTMDALKAKERMNEKVKADAELALKHKDLKIDFLEQRIEEVKAEFSRSREFANEEKLEKLEVDNKTLQSRLDLANKKVNIISDNINNRDAEAQVKRDKELDSVRSNLDLAQSVIDSLKSEKIKLEIRVSEDRETIRKFKEEKGGVRNDEEKDGIIQVLTADRKALEEKFRAQAIELKKVEQKLKYTLSQLESSNKKKAAANPGQKTAETYAKQLDQLSSRMSEVSAEVGEKRREIVKLKQENSMMSTKITELEKKLAFLDKKVA
ncbi:hypothetical protein SHI21_03510 [Bacteriovorax sp. PP10]|uniref:Chromosome partition protein Smc n=1 Tax=Bacteriovorax antarcticus TaxID=3088717 RepID=A0ABU5VQD0_9BACT|nr:hypothetical protein [Bacteriovorax sp. PP10]MEA9355249.1 hypothetical protein [Bacteriovorax sp. PP10]